jgi:transcriptional regulator GlxA family with amidase domain
VSVCTGAYALAAAGLLDGRRATTHWRFASDLARQYPAIKLDTNAIFVKDGPFYTSAGVTAGIDLALALAEEDFGPSAALDVAREMVVFLKRPGGQAQFSQPLSSQIRSADRFSDLIAWMTANPEEDQRLEVLATKVSMTVRTFSRRFKDQVGRSPARYVEDLRLDASRSRLERRHEPIGVLAADLGFGSDDAFARAFSRRFGIRPSDYRVRFQTKVGP